MCWKWRRAIKYCVYIKAEKWAKISVSGVRKCCLVVNANGQPNSTIRILFDKQYRMCFILFYFISPNRLGSFFSFHHSFKPILP